MILHGMQFPPERIAEICRRHGVHRLALFGSILSERFDPSSDVDMLVQFEPGARISLLDIGQLQLELTELLGRQVHLTDQGTVPADVLTHLNREARVQYAA